MEKWNSYMAKGTKVLLLDNTTKNIEDLTTNDELIVMNGSDPSFDAANLEHNAIEGGFATYVDKVKFSLSEVVTIQLENGSEVTVTKNYPLTGADKSAGWQVFDIGDGTPLFLQDRGWVAIPVPLGAPGVGGDILKELFLWPRH